MAPVIADPVANTRLVQHAITEALTHDAHVVILPELVTTGYHLTPEEAAQLAEPVDGPSLTAWAEALHGRNTVVIGGFCERDDDGTVYNSAAVVTADGPLSVYRKTHLWDQEFRLFTPGDTAPPVVETTWGPIGVAICYDLFFPEIVRSIALTGAHLLAVPTNSPYEGQRSPGATAEEGGIGHVMARSAAYVNRMFVAVSDRHGDERGAAWTARSSIVDPEGRFLAGPVGYREELLLADCDLAQARQKRWENSNNDAFSDRRPALYGAVTTTT